MHGQGLESEWREQVLEKTLLWASRLGFVMAAVAVTAIVRTQPARLLEPGFLFMFAAFACTMLLRYRPTYSYHNRALAFCWLLWLMGSSGMYNVGALPGPMLCNTLAVVCAGLFLGRGALWLLLAASTATTIGFGIWNTS